MNSSVDRAELTRTAFPHSEIPGSKVVSTSPELIAADHVLHRLSVPEHPPHTLKSLTTEIRTPRSVHDESCYVFVYHPVIALSGDLALVIFVLGSLLGTPVHMSKIVSPMQCIGLTNPAASPREGARRDVRTGRRSRTVGEASVNSTRRELPFPKSSRP